MPREWGAEAWSFQRTLPESDAVLWSVVILASVFDVVTTIVGIGAGLSEANAVARAFLHTYGTPGIGLLKFSALVLVAICWVVLPDRYGRAALQGMAVVSVGVVAINSVTLAPI